MGLSAVFDDHARHRHGAGGRADRGQAPRDLRTIERRRTGLISGLISGLIWGLTALLWALPGTAEPLRIASWHADLSRDGPGLLVQDIQRGNLAETAATIAALDADILLLTDIDYDADLLALAALNAAVSAAGGGYAHLFAWPPNTGLPTGLDLDRNGRLGEARDAQGYGRFVGQGGMALMSRYPVDAALSRDHSALLWADLPGSRYPASYFGPEAAGILRLSHGAHWELAVDVAGRPLTLMAFAATTPVFDGEEDRNGLRNADEIDVWRHRLNGALGPTPEPPFVILGKANLDPADGDGRREVIAALLADPRLQDPAPEGPGGAEAANPGHVGPPAQDTADYRDPRPGNLRTTYVLPSADLTVTGAGVAWPAGLSPERRSRHFPVWVDLEF